MSILLLAAVTAIASPSFGQIKPAGYLAEPKAGNNARGVLVLHAWWGLNADAKNVCDRLAKAGYCAFAPDLFGGKIAKTEGEAKALVGEYMPKHEAVRAQIVDAAKYLEKKTGKKEVGVIGFSFGAYYGLAFSNAEPTRAKAVVVFYGTGHEDFSKSKASYQGHFAEKDDFEPKESVDSLEKILKDAKRPVTMYTYPSTGHWFFEPSIKSAYDKPASELAWKRTLEFLRKSL